jgi:hypothetical protein
VPTGLRVSKSCYDWLEGWVFCGFRILTYKYERARAVMRIEDAMLMGRVAEKMREEMRKESSRRVDGRGGWLSEAELDAVVLQTNGDGYASPLLGGRFQVMESFLKGSYYVVDHLREDLLVRIAGLASDTRRFTTIGDAEAYIKGFTPSEEGGINPFANGLGIPSDQQEKSNMAKVATKKVDPKKIDTKKTEPKAAASTWKNQAEAFRTMISDGKLDDDAILTAVRSAFPDKKVVGSSVTYYRARMS